MNRTCKYVAIIGVLCMVVSCSCKNASKPVTKKKPGTTKETKPTLPHLVLNSDKTTLQGDDVKFQLELKNDSEGEANLSEYTLQISLQEEGRKGSMLHYQDAENASHDESEINQSLSYFTKQPRLKKGDPKLILPFELRHLAGLTKVTITITLEHKDKKGNVSPIPSVVWKKLPPITDKMIEGATEAGYSFLAEVLTKLKKGEVVNINSISTDGQKDTALHQVATLGDIAILKALIERGSKLNEKNNVGYTPLHKAAFYGKTEVAKLLIDRLDQSQLNEKDLWGGTPLHLALYNDNTEMVKLLIKKLNKSQLNEKNNGENTPLHVAIDRGHIDIFNLLIDQLDQSQLNEKNNDGDTPLHRAIKEKQKETIKILIEKLSPEQLNVKDNCKTTPLMGLLLSNPVMLDVVSLLIKKLDATDLNEKHNEATPLFWMISEVYQVTPDVEPLIEEVIEKLTPEQLNEKTDWGVTILEESFRRNCIEVASVLIKKLDLAQLTEKNSNGDTPLHSAVIYGHPEIAQEIIEKLDPAQLTEKNNNGDTPLHWAVIYDHPEIAQEIIEKLEKSNFTNWNIQDKDGNTPLHFAARLRLTGVAKLLITKSDIGELNKMNTIGLTPLHTALHWGSIEIATFLISKLNSDQLSMSEQNEFKNTALYLAIAQGYLEIAETLVEKLDANQLNQKNGKGNTALHVAVETKQLNLVRKLLAKGVDKTIKNNDGNTPFDLARTQEIRDLLL